MHAFKNPTSALTIRAKMALCKSYATWALTATPLSRDMEDTYNIVNFIYPWFLGPFHTFKRRYCTVVDQIIGRTPSGALRKVEKITGVSDESGLQEKLAPILITGVSEIKPEFHFVDYTPDAEEYKLYRKIANGIDVNADMNSEEWLSRPQF